MWVCESVRTSRLVLGTNYKREGLAFEYFHLKKRFSSGQETQLTTATRADL